MDLTDSDGIVGHTSKTAVIERIVRTRETKRVYNMRVAQSRTYFVGESQWDWSLWVHNTYRYEKLANGLFGVFNKFNRQVGQSDLPEDVAKQIVEAFNKGI